MSGPSRAVQDFASTAVALWADARRGVSAALAAVPGLAEQPDEVRAAVARLAQRTIGALPRLLVALGGRVAPGRALPAGLLVQAALVERGEQPAVVDPALPSRDELARALDAVADEAARFAARHALPTWLVAPLRAAFGGEVEQVLASLAEPAPRTLRANLLRCASRDDLRARLAEEGVECAPARFAPTAAHAAGCRDLFRTRAFADGCFEQQDEASQLAVMACAPPPGGRVLDLCCGSGGKTLALAAALQNRGAILACDVHEGRVRELRRRLARAGVDNVRPRHAPGGVAGDREVAAFARRADRILIDAPCSGTGSWRRRPDARSEVSEAACAALRATQAELLDHAAAWLRPRARIVYATCSLLPDENERQVEALLARRPELERVRLAEILGARLAAPIADPSGTYLSLRPDRHGTDGFFLAVLRRRRGV